MSRTIRLYRICPEQFLENYSGLGASYQSGARWNKPGQPVLYFSLSAATALLEMAHYIPTPRLVPASYRLGVYELPASVEISELSAKQLPLDWAQYPFPDSTQTLGDKWLKSGASLALQVPSAAVPSGLEAILVINPRHPDCKKMKLLQVTDDLYNHRAFSGIY